MSELHLPYPVVLHVVKNNFIHACDEQRRRYASFSSVTQWTGLIDITDNKISGDHRMHSRCW